MRKYNIIATLTIILLFIYAVVGMISAMTSTGGNEREAVTEAAAESGVATTEGVVFEPIETEVKETVAEKDSAENSPKMSKDALFVEIPETETETHSAVLDQILADENDVLYLAKIIYNEAGLSIYSDEHQLYVGSVVLNRLGRSDFAGDTILELALCGYGDGYPIQYDYSQFGDGAAGFWNIVPDERTIANARFLLENGVIDSSVVWQANFPQGSEVIRKFTYPGAYPATTYICR